MQMNITKIIVLVNQLMQAFIQKDVLGVEGLEFGIFCSTDFLGHEVIGAQVEGQADDAGDAHHVEGVQGPVVETLEEEKDAEDLSHTEGGTTPVQVTTKSSTMLAAQAKQRFKNKVLDRNSSSPQATRD